MGFKERVKKSKATEDWFVKWCIEKRISYAYSGYEKLKQSSRFKESIQSLRTTTAKRIRYYPDLTITGKKAWLAELKNSAYIEKDSYLTLRELMKVGFNVVLINIIHNKLLVTKIECLRLMSVGDNVLPHDGIWIYPRRLPNEEYEKWKKEHPNASGTPYGILDYENSENITLIEKIL